MHLQWKRSGTKRVMVLSLLICFGWMKIAAQEVLTTDAGFPMKAAASTARAGYPASDLRITTLSLPFFDDFSADSTLPDAGRWSFHPNDTHRPTVSVSKGHNVPSKGVATFDGANMNGRKYETTFLSGMADTLTSMPIDLSGFGPADSVYLSFFVERGGAGEAPEATDSLVVLFDSVGDYSYTQVWALHGNGAASGVSESTFNRYFIVLDAAQYFHSAFRFKFVAYGNLNGELDQFHLDYVHLAAGQSKLNTQLNDQSPERVVYSPMHPYKSMPRKQYRRMSLTANTRTIVANAGDPAATPSLSLTLDDPIGANAFAGTTIVSANANLAAFGHDSANGSAFSNQAAQMVQYGSLRMTALKTGAADAHPENDTLRTIFAIDSTLGYDDGESDFGYGLTTTRAFCQQYDIDQPDTLVAVWIHFAPTLHYNQALNLSTDLDGKGFRLVVWDSLSVDSSLIETSGGMNVAYGSTPNEFIRYPLIRDVIVPTRFWVGIRQGDGMPIGMGYDRSDTTRRIYFENNVAEFQRSNNRGALMIRPEFKVPNLSTAAAPAQAAPVLHWRVAPNPVSAPEIGVVLDEAARLRDAHFVLMDLQGRTLQAWDAAHPQRETSLDISALPAAGIYWLRLQAVDLHGNLITDTQKLLIQQP
jgi:hypothetical protein